MESLLQIGLANAAAAALLAICVVLVTRVWRNPYLAHALWLIVLLRLIAPPILRIPVSGPSWFEKPAAAAPAPDAAVLTIPESSAAAKESGERLTRAQSVPSGFGADRDVATPSTTMSSVAPARDVESVAPDVFAPDSVPPAQSAAWPIRWIELLAAIWIAGTILYAAGTAVRVRRFALGVRRAQVATPTWLEDEIRELAGSLGLRRSPRLTVVEGALPPMVWCGWRPTLLVPQTVVESMGSSQRRLLLLHELLHLRRRDHLIRWFAVAVLALYWWNPIAWWAVRRLQNAEEECCDAAVLWHHPQQSTVYGEALLAVSEFVSCGTLPVAAVSIGVERKNHLRRRMTMILKGSRWPRLSRSQCAAVIGCGAVLIGVSLTTAAAQVEPLTVRKPAPKTDSDKAKFPPHQQAALIPAVEKPAAPGKTGLALYDAKPLTISPGDDELHKLLKQEYNAALAKMTYYLSTFQTGNASLGDLSAAAKSVLDAELALDEKPPRDLRAIERYLEFTKYLEKMAESRLSVGGAGGENPALEAAQMREARLGAEIKLQDRRIAAARRSQASAAEPLPGAPQPTRGSSQAERLPAMLTASPLLPVAGDDELQKLVKERYNSALKSLQRRYERCKIDTSISIATILGPARTLLDAKLALVKPQDTVGVYYRYLEFMKYLEALAEKELKKGTIGTDEVDAVREARLDAEVRLRELQVASVTKSTDKQAALVSPPESTKRQIRNDWLAFVQLLEVRVRIAEAEVNAVRAVVEQSEAELKRAMTNLKYREGQFGRVQSARKQAPNVISQDGFDEALRDRDAAAASVELAKAAIHAAQAQVAIKAALLEQVQFELKQAREADNK